MRTGSKPIKSNNTKEKIPNSEWFLAALILVVMVISTFININILYVEMFIGSFLTIGLWMDGADKYMVWRFLMPLTWGICIIAGIVIGIQWFISNTIGRFMDWLDRDRAKNKILND